jgi:hypothetical protein
MPYIVYVTDICKDEAKKHNSDMTLSKLKDTIEKNQSISLLERFGSSKYLVKKKFGSVQGRLIACEENYDLKRGKYTAIIFLTIFIRGDKDYTAFQRNPDSNEKGF